MWAASTAATCSPARAGQSKGAYSVVTSAKAKSLFLLPAVVVSAGLCVLSIVLALTGGSDRLAWWGAAFAALPLPIVVLALQAKPRPRASESAPLALFVASIGTFLAAWEWLIELAATWQPFAVGCGALALLLLYIYWYARFGRITSSRFDAGQKMPEFTVTDLDGNAVDSEEFVGKPAVLLFYRGNWDPLCVGQVAELAEHHEEFDRLGITVALISPQGEARTRELANRFDTPFHWYVDRGNEAAEALDIAVRGGVPFGLARGYDPDTVMPTVVATSANGTIVYADQTDNYRLRPEPDIFLAILRRSGDLAG